MSHSNPTTSPPPGATSKKAHGLSVGGAEAIIGIGCAIAGALIAGLISFLLMRRKKGPRSNKHAEYAVRSYTRDSKNPASITVGLPESSSAAIIENYLPQSREDNAIIGDFSRIKNKIDGHVQTFYASSGGNDQACAQALVAVLGNQSPIPVAQLPALLASSRTRPSVLRAAIAWVIISRIGPDSNPRESFLPVEVAGTLSSLSHNKMDDRTRMAFISKWKAMTAALSSSLYGQDTMSNGDPRITNIRSTLQTADSFLAPIANSEDHEARLRNLEEIMKRAGRFGWLVFSQPSSFRFDWANNGAGLVVFPGLLQVTDENGQDLATSRPFGQKEVAPV